MAEIRVRESGLFRKFFGNPAPKQSAPRIAWAIDADTLTQAVFGLDGDDCDPALAGLDPHEKRELSRRIETRLHALGWAVEFGRGGVGYQGHEPFRKLREISETGGVFFRHIVDMIDRCHDYAEAKKRLGRAALYPWPIKEVADRLAEKFRAANA